MSKLTFSHLNIIDLSVIAPKLIAWYEKHKRDLPWRKTTDPYCILVSEVMLQQTTVKVVIPYYEKFIKRFNDIKVLAQADLKEILPYWSGLGYYSRVKNLHKAAKIIHQNGHFPKTYKELLKLPGLGPYTSRAVSTLAFGERVAVLDSNVIRVMARFKGFKQAWWNQKGRAFLQKTADKWVTKQDPALINQALMELGALVCRRDKPLCLLCPLSGHCQAFLHHQTDLIPLRKKKKAQEIWLWKPQVCIKNQSVAMTFHHALPVLKNQPLFPGPASKRKVPPRHHSFVHFVTHHAIYVLPSLLDKPLNRAQFLWVNTQEVKKQSPSTLVQKVLKGV